MAKGIYIEANGLQVEVRYGGAGGDFISLTDIAKYRTAENPGYVIQNWMRTRNTVRFLGLWEHFHNPEFNYLEFEAIEREAGLNSFVLTPKRWVELYLLDLSGIQTLHRQGLPAAQERRKQPPYCFDNVDDRKRRVQQ